MIKEENLILSCFADSRMAISYGTAALMVTIGTISLILGLILLAVGFINPDEELSSTETLLPNGTVTFEDFRMTSLPLIGVGITATVFGYMLWFVLDKQTSNTKTVTANGIRNGVRNGVRKCVRKFGDQNEISFEQDRHLH